MRILAIDPSREHTNEDSVALEVDVLDEEAAIRLQALLSPDYDVTWHGNLIIISRDGIVQVARELKGRIDACLKDLREERESAELQRQKEAREHAAFLERLKTEMGLRLSSDPAPERAIRMLDLSEREVEIEFP